MNEQVIALSNCYLNLVAWFISGMPSPLMREAYSLKAEVELVLRKLSNSQLTGVELVLAVKDRYRDPLPEVSTVH